MEPADLTINDSPSPPSTPLSPGVVSMPSNVNNNPRELRLLISALQSKVESLTNKVDSLDLEVDSLKTQLIKNEAALAVSQITSTNLRKELDRQEQYSRRNCIVLDGIKASPNDGPNEHLTKTKQILTDSFSNDDEIITGLDKAHPISPINNNGKQSFILRFNKHSIVSRLYRNRTNLKRGITARPSLTKSRQSILRSCQKTAVNIKSVNFVFSDIEGNLKVCFNDRKFLGRNIHTFDNEVEFSELIIAHDHYSIYPHYVPEEIPKNDSVEPTKTD